MKDEEGLMPLIDPQFWLVWLLNSKCPAVIALPLRST